MVNPAPTTTSLDVDAASTYFSQMNTFTATISVPAGLAIPGEGTVTFYDGARALGTEPVSGGTARFTTSTLAIGSHVITASYNDPADYAASSSDLQEASAGTEVPIAASAMPSAVAVDGEGDLFVALGSSGTVDEITPSGTATVFASGLDDPDGLAVNSAGDVFIAESGNNTLVEVTPSGQETTLDTALGQPQEVAVDSKGDVFVADARANRVVELPVSGSPTTIGTGLDNPTGVAVDSSGDVFIADQGNRRVVEVTPSGTQTTVASLSFATSVAVDDQGNVFVTDVIEDKVIEVSPQGAQTTVASSTSIPAGVAVGAPGDLFVANFMQGQVLKITLGVQVTVSAAPTSTSLAVSAGSTFFGESETLTATVSGPGSVAPPSGGTVTFYDGAVPLGTAAVSDGTATFMTSALTIGAHTLTASYSGAGDYAASASGIEPTSTRSVVPISDLNFPTAVAVDSQGDVFGVDPSSDEAVELTAGGTQEVIATGLDDPRGIAVNSAGDVFITNAGNSTLIEVTPSGSETTIDTDLDGPVGVAVDGEGDVFIADPGDSRVVELPVSGAPTTIGTGLIAPDGVAVDRFGDVFITDQGDDRVLEVTSSGTQTTLASLPNGDGDAVDTMGDVFIASAPVNEIIELTAAGTDMPVASGLDEPPDVALDSSGDLLIANTQSHQVLKVTPGVPVTVSADPTSTSLAASAGSIFFGQSETFIATVSVPAGVAPPSAGTVTFYDGTASLGTVGVVDGMASLTTSFLAVGTHTITAAYSGTPGQITAGVFVTVSQATPTITWNMPAAITAGTPLSTLELDATASVPGTFTYTPAVGTVLAPGDGQVLSVTFTPTDSTDYTSVMAKTTINVVPAPPLIVSERALFKRKLKHGKPVGNPVLAGYEINFSSRLMPISAELASNYEIDAFVTKTVKKRKVTSVQALTDFTVSYDDATESVDLLFKSTPSFKMGGEITVLGGPSRGVMGLTGAFVAGNRVLMISAGGKNITPA